MRVLLIRHAVTGETGTKLSGRLPGIDLSSDGVAQAEATAERLSEIGLDALYTSPIARCRQTATIIGRPHALTPLSLRDLVEADYGTWSGRSLRSLYKLKAWRSLMAAASRFRFPQGETLREVQHRAVGAVESLHEKHKKQTVALVSHSDVIRVMLAHYLGVPLDLIHRLHVQPASVSVIQLSASGPVHVSVVNSTVEMVRF